MIEKITLSGKEYPIAYNMLTFNRITKELGADNFKQLFDTVGKISHATDLDSFGSVTEILEPMGIIAHHGLYTGGVVSGEIYKLSIEETQGLFSGFSEVVSCFKLFMNQFKAFFTGEKAEPETKKKGKANP